MGVDRSLGFSTVAFALLAPPAIAMIIHLKAVDRKKEREAGKCMEVLAPRPEVRAFILTCAQNMRHLSECEHKARGLFGCP